MKRFRKGNHKGFTLVEIMSVVAIASMITAMSLPHFLSMRVGANEAAAQDSLKSMYTLIEDYRFANGGYPSSKDQISAFVNSCYGKQSIISNPDSGGNYFRFQGYRYDYRMPSTGTWEWIAMPDIVQVTGNRYFTITESGSLLEVNRSYASTNYSHTIPPGEDSGSETGLPPPIDHGDSPPKTGL